MQLAKSIIPKILNKLYHFLFIHKKSCCRALILVFLLSSSTVFAQDNSPYSRYGLGDLVPGTHINNRAMGGVSAGYSDFLSINFNNPASYSNFQSIIEQKSKK